MTARVRLARRLAPPLLRALAATWRIREIASDGTIGPPRRALDPAVHALWHAELLALMMCYASTGLATMISHHGDGEIAAAIVRRLGSRVVRGSSSFGGGAALDNLVEIGRQSFPLAITPDGPRGPARRCKPGVVRLAALSGLPVVPVGARPVSGWRFRSWDRFIVPKPCSIVYVQFGAPLRVPGDLGGKDVAAWLRRIDAAIDAVSERCARQAAGDVA